MSDKQTITETLKKGEYLVSDPALLQGMQTMCAVKTPGFLAILVARRTPITEKLIHRLQSNGIKTVFAEPAKQKRKIIAGLNHRLIQAGQRKQDHQSSSESIQSDLQQEDQERPPGKQNDDQNPSAAVTTTESETTESETTESETTEPHQEPLDWV